MVLQCPHCGASIPAGDVNIQKTLAVCRQCDHVFDFSDMIVVRKAKPRTPPDRLTVHEENNRLELSYRQVYGPGPRFGLAMASFASILLPCLILVMAARGASPPLLGMLGFMTCVFWYILAVFLSTTTQITVDNDVLKVRSGPLPFPLSDNRVLSTHDIKRIFCEDTLETWPPGPPGMPAHHVTADLYDGNRVAVATSLPRNYAVYIAEALDTYLHTDGDSETLARDGESDADTEAVPLEYLSDMEDERAFEKS